MHVTQSVKQTSMNVNTFQSINQPESVKRTENKTSMFLAKSLMMVQRMATAYKQFLSISSYVRLFTSENMQKCVKGKALEAVKSRLLLAANIPKIIETLHVRRRSEFLIHNLIEKIRNETSPNVDRFDMLLSLALHQLTIYVRPSKRPKKPANMNNPMLLHWCGQAASSTKIELSN